MSSPSSLPPLRKLTEGLYSPSEGPFLPPGVPPFVFSTVSTCVIVGLLSWLIFSRSDAQKLLPRINTSSWYDPFEFGAKAEFIKDANGLMSKASRLWPQKPYRIMTDTGEMVLLPPGVMHEMRNEPNLDFAKVFSVNLQGNLPGFEPFAFGERDDELTQKVIKRKLTKRLNLITKSLSDECSFAIDNNLGLSTEWHKVEMRDHILDITARLSSRAFLGAEVCRNPAWLEITKMYTIYGFQSAAVLRAFPSLVRPLANRFLPGCKIMRHQISEARRIIQAVLDERRGQWEEAVREGNPVPSHDDAIDWFEEESKDGSAPYDPVAAQLGLSAAAIHTTTDLCHEVILRIGENPKLFDDLREEIVSVLRVDGGAGSSLEKKTTLNSMHLLDSVIKETQRLKPTTTATMHRIATADVTLPDGMCLRKGEMCLTGTAHMQDPAVYGENAHEFDGFRFLRMKQLGTNTHHHLVSTSTDHIGFGHGLHACPGRFFAANEIKIIMCHLLLKYDWGVGTEGGYARRYSYHGLTSMLDTQAAEIRIRRRRGSELAGDDGDGVDMAGLL